MFNQGLRRVFYGWWIVLAAFLNLLFAVGIIFYGFPVFYPFLVESLGFTRAQLTQGFLLGFLVVGLLFALVAGVLIDRYGPRSVILVGVVFVGGSLVLMGRISKLWQYYALCISEVVGYTLAGPIPNQVLIANWFRARRGRAMGYAYLGLGLGGAVSPVLVNHLIGRYGWRHAFEAIGILILVILLPVAQWVTRSAPRDIGLRPDGAPDSDRVEGSIPETAPKEHGDQVARAVRTPNFWLIVGGCTLVIGAIGAVIQQRRGLYAGYGLAHIKRSAALEPGRPRPGGLLRGPLYQEERNGAFLFAPGTLHPLTVPCAPAFRRLVLCGGLWIFHGSGLHAHPAGDRRMLRPERAGQAAGLDHHGLFARAVVSALAGRKNLRRLSQLPSRLVHNDSGSHSRCRGSLRHYTKTGDE